MKSVLTAFRPLRVLFSLCICALMILSTVLPATAAPMRNEPNPSANSAAKKYEQVSREPLESGHPGPSLQEAQEKTNNGGLNEVQGRAAIEDMKRPSNAKGSPAVESKIQDALEKVQDKIDDIKP